MSAVYCQECGFQNPESANYCSRCGALLTRVEHPAETTQTFQASEEGDLEQEDFEGRKQDTWVSDHNPEDELL